jgi:hypothetical protein
MNDSSAVRNSLARQGVDSAELAGSDGGSLLVASAGARILRLTDCTGLDHLWLHPALARGEALAPESTGWLNFGGARTWIAPEVDFFVTDRGLQTETYGVPVGLDPGAYTLEAAADAVRLRQSCSLLNHATGAEVPLSLEKLIRPVENPLHDLREAALTEGVTYLGYEQTTTLSLPPDAPAEARVGLWDLAQVPRGGVMAIPLTVPRVPRIFLGAPAPGQLEQDSRGVRVRVDGHHLKIGLQAACLVGRMGYLRQVGPEAWALLVRNWAVNPSGQHVDPPWDDPTGTDLGYAAQCYVDDGGLGGFGELEYHAAAVGAGTGLTAGTDVSQIWGFHGPAAALARIAEQLLGPVYDGPVEA